MKRLVVCGCVWLFPLVVAFAQEAPRATSPATSSPPAAEQALGLAVDKASPGPAAETSPVANAPRATLPESGAPAAAVGTTPSVQSTLPATEVSHSAAAADAPVPASVQTEAASPSPTKILLPHDLSPWSMFLSADVIVKAVMIGLAFASLLTWTIFFAKSFEFAVARRRLRRGLQRLDGKSFAEARLALGRPDGVLRGFLDVAERELSLSERRMWDSGAKERCDSELGELARNEVQAMRRGMPFLATVGSTAPFVGLFGTVWGIMNSFIGISKSQTTNLAVVAPGIAEALLATAIGLVAAIPAVVIYNHFSQSGRRYQHLIAKASGTVQRMMSREFDRRLVTTKSAE